MALSVKVKNMDLNLCFIQGVGEQNVICWVDLQVVTAMKGVHLYFVTF